MTRVFLARDPMEARLVKVRLERAGIPAEIRGETLSYVRPEIEIIDKDSLPSVWIRDDTQLKTALDVVAEHLRGPLPRE